MKSNLKNELAFNFRLTFLVNAFFLFFLRGLSYEEDLESYFMHIFILTKKYILHYSY